jgi:hypothetical protein
LVDILFYFYEILELKKFFEKEIKPYRKQYFLFSKTTLPLSKIVTLKEKYNCIVSVAHPYGYSMRAGSSKTFDKHESIFEKVDVIEAVNGSNPRISNKKAMDYLMKKKKSFTGGSDGHSIYTLGNVLTCSNAKTVREFLDNIKTRKNIVYGEELRFGKFSEYFYYGLNKVLR